jgi:hypothetical protein
VKTWWWEVDRKERQTKKEHTEEEEEHPKKGEQEEEPHKPTRQWEWHKPIEWENQGSQVVEQVEHTYAYGREVKEQEHMQQEHTQGRAAQELHNQDLRARRKDRCDWQKRGNDQELPWDQKAGTTWPGIAAFVSAPSRTAV